MKKLFQQSNSLSSSLDSELEAQNCYSQIAALKQQLSSIGIQHLLKVRQLEEELEKSKYQIESIGGIRQILENQVEEMGRELKQQYKYNQTIEEELLKWRQERERGSDEQSVERGSRRRDRRRRNDSEDIRSEDRQDTRSQMDATQQQLNLMNEKVQLLQLKNQALIEQLAETRDELEQSKSKWLQENNRYERRIHQLSSTVERLNIEGDSLTIIRNQNNILHKQLELKICEVDELTRKLLQIEKEQQQISEQEQSRNSQERRLNNLNKQDMKQYLEQAIFQIEQLRKQNQHLKSEQSNDKNAKSLKTQLIAIKAEYSNSLRQNNHLIEENAKLEKQKNQLTMELEKLKRGDASKRQKAYITICEEKNQMQVELMNTYQQIEKLNDMLLKKQTQIQQLVAALGSGKTHTPTPSMITKKKDIFVNQGFAVKLVMQNAEQLSHDHWENIENKIKMLKTENQALKRGGVNLVGYNR